MSIVAAFMVPHPPLIVPEVGRGGEAQIAQTAAAYEEVARRIADLKPDTIIISSPHSVMYSDYFHISPGKRASGSLASFHAPQVRFQEEYDEELVQEAIKLAEKTDFPAGTMGERDADLDHGTMVPLYFIRKYYQDFRIVRIGLSGLPFSESYRMGQLLKEAVDHLDRRVVYVASGDLSHKLQSYGPYGFAKEGPQYDQRICEVCGSGRFGELFDFSEDFCEKAAECGHRSFVMMAGALDGLAVEARLLCHQDVTGVGYGICSFEVKGREEDRCFLRQYEEKALERLQEQRAKEDPYVRLARASVESYVAKHRTVELADVFDSAKDSDIIPSELLQEQAGAFVSIHKNGALRGCIGTFVPTQDRLADEIIQNAISASTRDPRFPAITEKELPYLEISVDVLSAPQEVQSEAELDCKRYGVIVSSGRKRGLLLPDLEGVDTVEDQIDIARRKAGIGRFEKVSLQRFEVVRHK